MPAHRVAVDPGHGGTDPGAVAVNGTRESDLNLSLARHFVDAANADGTFEAVLIRPADLYLSLSDRCKAANDLGASCVVSLHCNACASPDVRGFEVWTTPAHTQADELATAIYDLLALGMPAPGRPDWDDGDPDREAYFYVLRHTLAPAVLVEFGFLTNAEDLAWLELDTNRCFAAAVVELAVSKWLKGQP